MSTHTDQPPLTGTRDQVPSTPAVEQPRVTARSMLFDLYGDFADEGGRGGAIRLGAVVRLAAEIGFGEAAVRSAASRMVQDGWLVAEREGRESVYALAPRGRKLVEEGRRRIFRGSADGWDGTWYAVALSVPEARRDVRDRMRQELAWLGFGSPSNALYVSPRDHRPEVLRLAQELGAGAYLQVYRAEPLWPESPGEFVRRAWGDLRAVDERYGAFLARFGRPFARDRARWAGGTLTEREAFQTRFALVNHFRRCLFGDPDLPPQLLPAGWRGTEARQLFLEYHEMVTPPALAYFDAVCAALANGTSTPQRRIP